MATRKKCLVDTSVIIALFRKNESAKDALGILEANETYICDITFLEILAGCLTVEKREYVIAKQLLRSGTSIGANLSEAQYSISRKEFISKASISLKECAETEYWLDLLKEINLLTQIEYDSIIEDNKELLRLLTSTIKTTKQRTVNS